MNNLTEILKLSVQERILLAEKIWDSINIDEIELTKAHQQELDIRLERLKSGVTNFSTWENVKKQLY